MNIFRRTWLLLVSVLTLIMLLPGYAAGYLFPFFRDAFKEGERAHANDYEQLSAEVWAAL